MTTIPNAPIDLTAGSRARVLVVDDDGVSRRFASYYLSSYFDVVEATDATEALEIMKSTPDLACIVLDDFMPGMSGLALAQFMRRSPDLNRIPVVIVSGGCKDSMRRHAEGHKAGAAAFINKPFNGPQLLGLVSMLANQSGGRKTA